MKSISQFNIHIPKVFTKQSLGMHLHINHDYLSCLELYVQYAYEVQIMNLVVLSGRSAVGGVGVNRQHLPSTLWASVIVSLPQLWCQIRVLMWKALEVFKDCNVVTASIISCYVTEGWVRRKWTDSARQEREELFEELLESNQSTSMTWKFSYKSFSFSNCVRYIYISFVCQISVYPCCGQCTVTKQQAADVYSKHWLSFIHCVYMNCSLRGRIISQYSSELNTVSTCHLWHKNQ